MYSPFLPLLNFIVRNKISVQPNLQPEWKTDDRNRALKRLCIENDEIIAHLIQAIHQPHQVTIAFLGIWRSRNEYGFLNRAGWTGKPDVLLTRLPVEMTQTIEQTADRWTAFCKVVRLRGIDDTQEEMLVILCNESIVDAGKFTVGGHGRVRFVSRIRGIPWIEFPARHGGVQFIPGSYRARSSLLLRY